MGMLFELGIDDKEIKNMIELCPSILDMNDDEIRDKIDILSYIGCNIRHIRNIIISNPNFFDRINDDIFKLIGYLREIGINDVYLLFDSNPYLLNKDVFEIEEYINNRKETGMSLEEIVDEFDSNPYIIDEI